MRAVKDYTRASIVVGHILFWVLVFFQDISSFPLVDVEEVFNFILDNLTRLFIFYVNYFLLTPHLLKKKRYFLFALSIPVVVIFMEVVYVALFNDLSFDYECGECLVFYFIGNALYLLISTAAWLLADWIRYSRIRSDLKLEHRQMQISILKNQISPHFFFNNLNSLYSLCLDQSPKAAPMVLKLSSMMRYVIYEGGKEKISLQRELEAIMDFTRLQELKKSDNSYVEFYEEGIEAHHQIAPLILINFVENAFKHSNFLLEKDTFIDISAVVADDLLTFTIENNISFSKSENMPSGVGLKNLRRQLELIYPERHKLDLMKDEDTFKVILELDLSGEDEEKLRNN